MEAPGVDAVVLGAVVLGPVVLVVTFGAVVAREVLVARAVAPLRGLAATERFVACFCARLLVCRALAARRLGRSLTPALEGGVLGTTTVVVRGTDVGVLPAVVVTFTTRWGAIRNSSALRIGASGFRGAWGARSATSACEATTEATAATVGVPAGTRFGLVVGAVVGAVVGTVVSAVVVVEGAGAVVDVVLGWLESVGSASASGVSGVPVGSSVLVVGDVVGLVVGDVVSGEVVVDVGGVVGVVLVVGLGVRTGVVGVAPGVVMTVVTCSTTVGVAASATSSLAALAATVTSASTTGALSEVTTPAEASVVETAAGTVAASAGVRLVRNVWVVTALTSDGVALLAVAAVAALRASVAALDTAVRTARSTAGVRVDCTESSCCLGTTADSVLLTASTTIWRVELASWSDMSPMATTRGGGVTGAGGVVGCVVRLGVVGPVGRVVDDGRELPLGRCTAVPPFSPRSDGLTVKPDPGAVPRGRVVVLVLGLANGMASTTPGPRSPWSPGCSAPSPALVGMNPSTATPVSVWEEPAATAAAGAPERTAREPVAPARAWRAREVGRPLMSSSRSGVSVVRSASPGRSRVLGILVAACPSSGGDVGRTGVRLERFSPPYRLEN
jgi:hypothetical protein